MARSSRQCSQFALRMPQDIKGKLEKSAEYNGRSLTAEILTILERALDAANIQGSNATL